MDYDFRNRASSQYPMYGHQPATSSSSGSSPPMYHQGPSPSFYPKIGQQQGHTMIPPVSRASSHHQTSSSSGLGIRVALKPEYRITPSPQMSPQIGEIRRSNFQFDFDFERRVLAEAEKDSQNWSRLSMENVPPKTSNESSSLSAADPVASKYIASGLNRDAVHIAVANYGDNPTKVRDFVNGYNLLREMGFSSHNVAEVLLMYENDTDKALAHFLNGST